MRCARCEADLDTTRLAGLCAVCLLEAACADQTDATKLREALPEATPHVTSGKVEPAP